MQIFGPNILDVRGTSFQRKRLKTVQRPGAGNFNLVNGGENEKEVRNTVLENRPVIVGMVVGELIIEFFCDEGTELDAI